jgi:hypothetical protein
MTTMTKPVPLRTIEPGEVQHPRWCSPDHCRADRVGKSHESAPAKIGDLTMTAAKSVMDCATDAIVMIDASRGDIESTVVIRFLEIPTFVKSLMDLYVKQ